MRLKEQAEEALLNEIEREDFPERFTPYPYRPQCRYLPTPELIHRLIFQSAVLYKNECKKNEE